MTYLSRYVHRVAISNHRRVALQDGEVTFRYKDDKRQGELRTLTLKAVEFLRRFTLHLLPKGLHKIRSFGDLANCHRRQKLTQCRTLLRQSPASLAPDAMDTDKSVSEPEVERGWLEPGDPCPVCHKGQMQLVETYYRHPAAWDLSVAPPRWDPSERRQMKAPPMASTTAEMPPTGSWCAQTQTSEVFAEEVKRFRRGTHDPDQADRPTESPGLRWNRVRSDSERSLGFKPCP